MSCPLHAGPGSTTKRQKQKTQMWEEDGAPQSESVTSGYAHTLNDKGQSIPEALGTRVSQNAPKTDKPK
ncbi:YheV family putative metal-binding protein, partial [Pseudomonas aeruginosa]